MDQNGKIENDPNQICFKMVKIRNGANQKWTKMTKIGNGPKRPKSEMDQNGFRNHYNSIDIFENFYLSQS